MRMLGAEVRGVSSGSRTLKDAINEAMRDWVTNVRTTHYLLGSVLGAHPYPTMVRDFHRVIGREARAQILEKENRLPTAIIACVGGGSNAIGAFYEFIPDKDVRLIGVEAGGRGSQLGEHAARFSGGAPGVLQGTYSYVCRMKMARSPLPTPSQRASTTRRSAPSTLRSTTPAALNTPPSPTLRHSTPPCASPALKASFQRSKARTPSPNASASHRP
jgi:hypothetical protein